MLASETQTLGEELDRLDAQIDALEERLEDLDPSTDDAANARKVLTAHKPSMTRDQYVESQEGRFSTRRYKDE